MSLVRIGGLVDHPLTLTYDVVARAPHITARDDFHCVEGWSRPNQVWQGYWLANLISLADPRPAARFVEVGCQNFVTVLPLPFLANSALLADSLNGHPLTHSTGGPWRLVVLGGSCYQSIKWVDRVPLVDHDHGNTAREMALNRLREVQSGE